MSTIDIALKGDAVRQQLIIQLKTKLNRVFLIFRHVYLHCNFIESKGLTAYMDRVGVSLLQEQIQK